MTEKTDNRVQHGYYYAPLQNGRYASAGRDAGSQLLKMGAEIFAGDKWGEAAAGVAMAINEFAGDPVGTIGANVGEGAGWYVDNITNIHQNLNTMIDQLNDPKSWHPDLGM